jgi:predicted nucleotidyltransferase
MYNTTQLEDRKLIQPPKWLTSSIQYETRMGSWAYGTHRPDSDVDLYGFCLPPLEYLFPHLAGEIPDFGQQLKRFKVFEVKHIIADDHREYDANIYSITWYFQLSSKCNPNMVDSLFTPQDCVVRSTKIGNMVRDRRQLFLSKAIWHTYRGFCHSQMAAIEGKKREPDSKRGQLIEEFGYDVKFGMHAARALLQAEDALESGDMDLRKHSDFLRGVLKGNLTLEQLRGWVAAKEKAMEALYQTSTLPWGPDENALKQLLVDCMEEHYGSLAQVRKTAVETEGKATDTLRRIKGLCEDAGV